jgi:glycosyltransferase involved in cell wall biosynthesis
MNLPLITITICTYNGEQYLSETIESVLSQNYSNFEVIIVDDGSNDRTIEIIKQYAERDSRIRWFARKNAGLPASRNFAFSNAKGEWIAVIDQDDICYTDRLISQLKVAERNPDADLIFCDTNYINEKGKVIGTHLSKFKLPSFFIQKVIASELLLKQGCYIDSEAFFMRKSAILSIGQLDESLRYACDFEYFIRAGFKVNFAYTDEILSAWRIHAKQLSFTDLNRFNEVISVFKRYFFHKDVSYKTRFFLCLRLGRIVISKIFHLTIFRYKALFRNRFNNR